MAQATIESPAWLRRCRRLLFASAIEHLLDWAEPTIRGVCLEVDGDLDPCGVELADLYQEGRIAVFEAAEEIMSAGDPQALVATVVRRRVRNALRTLAWPDPNAPHAADDSPAVGDGDEDHTGRPCPT